MKKIKDTLRYFLQNYADFLIFRIENCKSEQEYEVLIAQAMQLDFFCTETLNIELQ
jgi:hypothetical protein